MNETPKDKMIRAKATDWDIYDKIAKGLSKQVGFRVPVSGAVRIAMLEYLQNHPEFKKSTFSKVL